MTTRLYAYRWSGYAFALFSLLFLHRLLLGEVRLWGVLLFLPPVLLATVATFESMLESTVFGIVFGALCDLVFAAPFPCLYTVSFMLAALLGSWISKKLLEPSFFCALCLSALSFVTVDLFASAALLLTNRATPAAILSLTLREMLVSLPLLLPCFPILRYIHRFYTP